MRELAGAIGSFGADVRAGMVEREEELSEVVEQRSGVSPVARHALGVATARHGAGAPSPRPPTRELAGRAADAAPA